MSKLEDMSEEVIAMYLADPPMTVSAICAEVGIYQNQVYTILDKAGIPRRGRGTPQKQPFGGVEPAIVEKLRVAIEIEKKSVAEASAELKVPYHKALRCAHELELTLVPGARPLQISQAVQKQIVADWRDDKMSIAEIMAAHGLKSTNVLYNILHKNGVVKLGAGDLRARRMDTIVQEAVRQVLNEVRPAADIEQLILPDLDSKPDEEMTAIEKAWKRIGELQALSTVTEDGEAENAA